MQLLAQLAGLVVSLWLTILTACFVVSLAAVVLQMIWKRSFWPLQLVLGLSQLAYALPFILVALIWVWIRDALRWVYRRIARKAR